MAATAETKLQEALNRLLAGQPRHTDGKLTKANLACEAQVSPATLSRTKSVIEAWNKRVADTTPRNPEAEKLREELASKKARIRDLEDESRKLKDDLTAAVAVIAELSARLTAKEQSKVVSIERP
ncbi:hypothetical protein M3G46_11105 [Corynebacterium sanguinis]|uniref:hypothetical protein n=1 Tax=Corynebacterium sanguinis TaxID=2594913 RepID=UPI0021A2DD19|nr:hypothetical protein [Corynebacterium sanguinis]MCT2253091.1 hypothetical protein [Corynebacterium sanguinis]